MSPAVPRYAVIGNPVAHSQSPWIHAEFARLTGQAINYERIEAPLTEFASTVRQFANEMASGCNITVPFKFEAAALASTLTERARMAGAVNTLRFDGTVWVGDNTDGAGLVRDIEENADTPIKGLRVLLLGAGGAAAGVLAPLLAAGPAELVLANRSREKADKLLANHKDVCGPVKVAVRSLNDCGSGFDVLINATSSSLSGQAQIVDSRVLAPGALALDMMYGPKAQGFLDWARTAKAHPRDGLGMLVEQAAEAFSFWRGVRPPTAAVLSALRARLGLLS